MTINHIIESLRTTKEFDLEHYLFIMTILNITDKDLLTFMRIKASMFSPSYTYIDNRRGLIFSRFCLTAMPGNIKI